MTTRYAIGLAAAATMLLAASPALADTGHQAVVEPGRSVP
jgi:hypothetical protein